MVTRLNSKQLSKFLTKHYINPDEYDFILVSDHIFNDGKFKNVACLPTLIPTPNVNSLYIHDGMTEAYYEAYMKQLSSSLSSPHVAILVNTVIKTNKNIIIVYSPSEDDMYYPEMLESFIKKVYGLPIARKKDLKENPDLISKPYPDNILKVVKKKLDEMIEMLDKNGVNIDPIIRPEEYRKGLKSMKKKKLIQYCETYGIHIDEDTDSKDEIIEKIYHRITLL